MNWKVFNLKYDKREQWAFEQLSYLLFCAEFNNRIGLFRYKNQTGIETEPIKKEGIYYGFQAKYYPASISKTDLIDSIKKAKNKNDKLNVIYIYLNKELSESSKTNKKKPQYQSNIEKAAQNVGIDIVWRVPSHFESQLSLPENKYIYDIFFNLDPSGGDLIDDVHKHNKNILNAIQTEIFFNEKKIKIDRSNVLNQIAYSIEKRKNLIISGEGGCGKTAVFKEFYNQNFQNFPICIYKATELNVNNINDLFRLDHDFSFLKFLETYKTESEKIFIIDSAEKLADISNNEILNNLIQRLKETGWNLVFITRYSYLNDLSFHIKENFQLSFEVIDISLIGYDNLKKLSYDYNFTLPNNKKFIERLRNLFYLNEYIQYYLNIDKKGDFRSFIDLLWKKRIQNNRIQKDNLHIERDRCIIHIAKERSETGHFYINAEDLPQPALFQLKQDEILGYDETHNGYFITHDIYEEWALDKIVARNYANYSDIKHFFDVLGDSLPIRRAFRLWLSDQLYENCDDIENFVQETFTNNSVTQFWKDELLISVLLSDYSETFFTVFEKKIIANDFKLLKRILFLLRIACTDISAVDSFDIIKPKGKGWEVVIALIYKHKVDFFVNNLNLILPILQDWCNNNKEGETTRNAGLLALSIIKKRETTNDFFIYDETEEKILKIVFDAANEIKAELKELFDKVIANKWNKHNDPYESLCSKILEKPYLALEVIRVLPLSVIQLCVLFWQKREPENDEFRYERDSMENRYGIVDEFKYNYHPAGALQTPIYWLLQNAFTETLDFIIDFTNRAVESYRQSDYGKEDVEEITLYINEQEITQYLSWALWGMYRGIGSPVVPYLLQSMHMALEKVLLDFSQKIKPEITSKILTKILINSKSASLTAIVCSITLANPEKYYDIALILFKTIEIFHIDSIRSTNEFHVKSMNSIGYGMDRLKDTLYSDERLKTCEDKHRSLNLEYLFLNYQFFGVKGFNEEQNAEFIKKLYEILDQHKSNILNNPEYEKESWGILLARMDRRNLTPKVSKHKNDYIIEFNPKNLSREQKEKSEEAEKLFKDTFKYSPLRTWSDFLIGKQSQIKSQKHKKYDNNPLLALNETKQLVKEIKSKQNEMGIYDYPIPVFACSKLIIEHNDKLSKEDKDFCKEIILSSISSLFSDNYDYQISDGVEASFHAIPSLMSEYPDEIKDYISIMVLSLFDRTPIGHYKRICDYVIESIHKSKLWQNKPVDAQAILLGYIKLRPVYNNIYNEKRKGKDYWERILKSSVLKEFEDIIVNFSFSNISFDTKDLDLLDIHDLEIIYQLIPSNTRDEIHLKIYKMSLPSIAPKMMMDRRSYKDKFDDNSNIYLLRLHIFRRFAYFILEREINEIDTYLLPFIDNFNATEETSSFLDEIISAEDYNQRYEQFWYVWNKLYPKFIEICNNSHGFYLDKVIKSYLLAWPWWKEGVEEWHSLKNENLSFYTDIAKEIGHIPTVLYSIAKILNSIGSRFKMEGIDLIHQIASNNVSLNMADLESNTLFYLERFMRKFIFIYKEKIKEEIKLKNKVIPILDFMIERGSIHGYLLRESIL